MSFNSRGTYAKINISHLKNNLKIIRNRIGVDAFLCPMIKANAYGHGDVEIAKVLEKEKIDALGVISLEEAIALRESGISFPVIAYGCNDLEYATKIFENKITPVISSMEQLQVLSKVSKGTPLDIHIKFNTGMNRLGFDPDEASNILEALPQNLCVKGICTHFLNGEDISDPKGYSQEQLSRFTTAISAFSKLKPDIHFLNSAALLSEFQLKDKVFQDKAIGARPGISLYGISPLSKKKDFGLKPVMSIYSRIESLQRVKKSDVVSYGPKWKALRDSLIGVIPIGYADGYQRSLTNQSHMIFKGKKVCTVGTVCMDYTMVDLTDVEKLQPAVGDIVTVMGEEGGVSLLAQDVAGLLGTIPYEILTRVGNRISRVVVST